SRRPWRRASSWWPWPGPSCGNPTWSTPWPRVAGTPACACTATSACPPSTRAPVACWRRRPAPTPPPPDEPTPDAPDRPAHLGVDPALPGLPGGHRGGGLRGRPGGGGAPGADRPAGRDGGGRRGPLPGRAGPAVGRPLAGPDRGGG